MLDEKDDNEINIIEMGNSWSTSLFAKRVLDNKSIPFSYVDAPKRRS